MGKELEGKAVEMLPVPVILLSLGGEGWCFIAMPHHTAAREQAEVEGSGCEILITSLSL